MNGGWIKLHRKILDNGHMFGKSYDFGIFVTLLLMADHKTGTLTIGRKQLAKRFRAKESTIYDALKRLEKQQQINIKTNNQFSTISIVKYNQYQTQTDNETKQKPTVNQQQTDTLQEVRIKNKEVVVFSDRTKLIAKALGVEPTKGLAIYADETYKNYSLKPDTIECVEYYTAKGQDPTILKWMRWIRKNVEEGKIKRMGVE